MDLRMRHNINRGYMKLEAWKRAQELVKVAGEIFERNPKIGFKHRDQVLGAVMSIPSNIAEGYCRRSIKEYIQYCYVSLGSAGEAVSRVISLHEASLLSQEDLKSFEQLHWDVENLLIALVRALERKRDEGTWENRMP